MGTASSLVVLLATVGANPTENVVQESVDLIEVNHFYDEHGRQVFDQAIFYEWCPIQCRYNVRAWRLYKSASQMPQRNWRTGGYDVMWHDGHVFRKVHASTFRETWTQYDPELIEREYLPKDLRSDLYSPRLVAEQTSGP